MKKKNIDTQASRQGKSVGAAIEAEKNTPIVTFFNESLFYATKFYEMIICCRIEIDFKLRKIGAVKVHF